MTPFLVRVTAAAALCLSLPGAPAAAAVDPEPSPEVTVREERGLYRVTARFQVPQDPAIVMSVLSDYERIPRFMPGVRTSVVLERAPGRLVVEQEAVSQFMMFSKKVHLVLEVTETAEALAFVDRCGRSFTQYEGRWHLAAIEGGTVVTYELSARPAFDVPGFILKRLLNRDSKELIGRLRKEFTAKATPHR